MAKRELPKGSQPKTKTAGAADKKAPKLGKSISSPQGRIQRIDNRLSMECNVEMSMLTPVFKARGTTLTHFVKMCRLEKPVKEGTMRYHRPTWRESTLIYTLDPLDIVFGRGNKVSGLAGNWLFRQIIVMNQHYYRASYKDEKSRIGGLLMQRFKEVGARFVEPTVGPYGNSYVSCFQEVTHEERILEKFCQALREKKNVNRLAPQIQNILFPYNKIPVETDAKQIKIQLKAAKAAKATPVKITPVKIRQDKVTQAKVTQAKATRANGTQAKVIRDKVTHAKVSKQRKNSVVPEGKPSKQSHKNYDKSVQEQLYVGLIPPAPKNILRPCNKRQREEDDDDDDDEGFKYFWESSVQECRRCSEDIAKHVKKNFTALGSRFPADKDAESLAKMLRPRKRCKKSMPMPVFNGET